MSIENDITQQQDEVSLKDIILKIKEIWKYLLSKWKIIVIVGISSAMLFLVYNSFIKKKEYVAKLTFAIIEKSSSGGGLSSLAGQFGFSVGGGGEGVFSGSNILELLKSRNLIERALLNETVINGKTYRLIDYYREINPPKNKDKNLITFPLGLERENFSREQDSLLNIYYKQITTDKLSVAKEKKDVNINNITYYNKDELFAKLFTETLINVVSDFYIQTKTQTTRVNLEMMEKRADSMKHEYEKALEGRALFADQNINPARQIMTVEQQKYQTTIQLTGTAYAKLVENIEILKLDLAQETPLIQIIDKPIMPLYKSGWGKIKSIVVGGVLGGFLIVTWLLLVYFYKRIMQ